MSNKCNECKHKFDAKEVKIFPQQAGELWKCGDSYAHTEQAIGVIWVCFMNMNHKIEDSDIIHGENWTRLFPPVEDDSVERIEIEGVICREEEDCVFNVNITFTSHKDLSNKPMKMILEYPKETS